MATTARAGKASLRLQAESWSPEMGGTAPTMERRRPQRGLAFATAEVVQVSSVRIWRCWRCAHGHRRAVCKAKTYLCVQRQDPGEHRHSPGPREIVDKLDGWGSSG